MVLIEGLTYNFTDCQTPKPHAQPTTIPCHIVSKKEVYSYLLQLQFLVGFLHVVGETPSLLNGFGEVHQVALVVGDVIMELGQLFFLHELVLINLL